LNKTFLTGITEQNIPAEYSEQNIPEQNIPEHNIPGRTAG